MPLPGSYSEESLALYMRDDVLMATGAVLGLTLTSQYMGAVAEVESAMGSAAPWSTDLRRVRILARREAWRLAMQQSGGDYSYTEDGVATQRQQIFEHARLMFEQAEGEAAALGPIETPDTGAIVESRTSFPVPNKAVW